MAKPKATRLVEKKIQPKTVLDFIGNSYVTHVVRRDRYRALRDFLEEKFRPYIEREDFEGNEVASELWHDLFPPGTGGAEFVKTNLKGAKK